MIHRNHNCNCLACNKPTYIGRNMVVSLATISRTSLRRSGAMIGPFQRSTKAKSLQDLVRKPYVGVRHVSVPTSTTQPRLGL